VWRREYLGEVDGVRGRRVLPAHDLGDDPEQPRYIRTKRGLGYRFVEPRG
jgi:DNA-binding response OmpR family regulator